MLSPIFFVPAMLRYPTIRRGRVRWEVAPRTKTVVRVLTLAGQVLMQREQQHVESLTLHLSELPAGVYLIWVNGEAQCLPKQ